MFGTIGITMNIEDLIQIISYITKDNGVPWRHKANLIRKRFEEMGELEALEEFVIWFVDTEPYDGN